MSFLDRRVEIFLNPRPYDRSPLLGQPRMSLAPLAHFLWGFDMTMDANVLAFRAFPKTVPGVGIAGWAIDWTWERRGPVWAWRRLRFNWRAREEGELRYQKFISRCAAEKREAA